MSFKVIFLTDTEHDLKNIHAYIESEFSETLAKKVYTESVMPFCCLRTTRTLGTPSRNCRNWG